MAYAVNYDVYKSMDALEDARRDRSRTSGRSSSTRSCTIGCARSNSAEEETLKALDLADNPLQLAIARRQMQEIRQLAARQASATSTGRSR